MPSYKINMRMRAQDALNLISSDKVFTMYFGHHASLCYVYLNVCIKGQSLSGITKHACCRVTGSQERAETGM